MKRLYFALAVFLTLLSPLAGWARRFRLLLRGRISFLFSSTTSVTGSSAFMAAESCEALRHHALTNWQARVRHC